MEKIQQAIEKARNSRDQEKTPETGQRPVNHAGETEITYTKTQTVNTSVDLQRENRIVSTMPDTEYANAFKILSTQVVHRMRDNNWKSLAVTSVSEGEGCTTTTINLGISIAKEVEYTVLVVDANLRDPEMHKYFGINPELGLSDYLLGNVELSDILIKPENIDHFVILPSGKALTNSSEMLGSPKMHALVQELKERYPKRMVLFDLPPVLGTADTLSFIPSIDATLLVVEDDATKEDDLKTAIEYLNDTNIIGTVLNKAMY